MKPFDLATVLPILERTPKVLQTWLANLPETWTHSNEGGESWSPFDIVGHFIHGEKTDWIPRANIILSDAEDRTLEPFDRFAQFEASNGKSMNDLLNEFAALRAANLDALRALDLSEANIPTLVP